MVRSRSVAVAGSVHDSAIDTPRSGAVLILVRQAGCFAATRLAARPPRWQSSVHSTFTTRRSISPSVTAVARIQRRVARSEPLPHATSGVTIVSSSDALKWTVPRLATGSWLPPRRVVPALPPPSSGASSRAQIYPANSPATGGDLRMRARSDDEQSPSTPEASTQPQKQPRVSRAT